MYHLITSGMLYNLPLYIKVTDKQCPNNDELAPPTKYSPESSPEHAYWSHMSEEMSGDKGCDLWSSLFPITEVSLTPSLLQLHVIC